MKSFTIHPIPLFECQMDKSQFTYRMNCGQPLTWCGYVWYIEGPSQKILVDAGGDTALFQARGIPNRDLQSIDAGLAKLGLGLDDIDIIIATQLHHDHIAHARRFPRAKVVVQKKELDFARKPHPLFAYAYPKEFFQGLNFEVIEGDAKIVDGVEVWFTPGHTAGGQSVVVETAAGKAVIAGLCTIRDNFEPPQGMIPQLPVIAPTIHTSSMEAYDSVLRIKEGADLIISLHDAEFRSRERLP